MQDIESKIVIRIYGNGRGCFFSQKENVGPGGR